MTLVRQKINLLKNGVRWFFGLGCVLLVTSYLPSHIWAAMSAIGLAVLLIPPLEKMVFSKIRLQVPIWGKVVSGIFLVGVMGTNSSGGSSGAKQASFIEPSIPVTSQNIQTETASKLDEIVKVIDGDTVQVKINGKSEVVRLIGIDTPESVDPRKPVQCFSVEATKRAKEILPTGKRVTLESDPTQGDKDKYNRLLRYVFFEDGTNFDKLMISDGYAHEYTYQVPYKYMEEFKETEKVAREAKRGLWADDACLVVATPTTKTLNVAPTTAVVPTVATQNNTSGGYSCGSKTKCGEMASCAEAMYYLNTCGVSRLDGDKDGVPCETLCK